jgi:hypothetical protein
MANAQDKIEGPWLWMIAPCEAGKGGAASTDVDSLKEASGGKVTEDEVAKLGPPQSILVGDLKWVEGKIAPTGGDNVQDMINANKQSWGGGWANLPDGIEDHSSYGFIVVNSPNAQNDVTMKVGSDDSIKVWLNGEVVHKNAVDRGASDYLDEFKVNLKSGKNMLLVKVSERGGGWSMFAGIDASALTYEIVAVEPAGKLASSWGIIKASF